MNHEFLDDKVKTIMLMKNQYLVFILYSKLNDF